MQRKNTALYAKLNTLVAKAERIEELSVGDWVFIDNTMDKSIGKIARIHDDSALVDCGEGHYLGGYISHIEPIPLTPEILEKNGFECSYAEDLHCSHYRYENMELLKWNSWKFWKFAIHNNGIFANILECRVSDVHQAVKRILPTP